MLTKKTANELLELIPKMEDLKVKGLDDPTELSYKVDTLLGYEKQLVVTTIIEEERIAKGIEKALEKLESIILAQYDRAEEIEGYIQKVARLPVPTLPPEVKALLGIRYEVMTQVMRLISEDGSEKIEEFVSFISSRANEIEKYVGRRALVRRVRRIIERLETNEVNNYMLYDSGCVPELINEINGYLKDFPQYIEHVELLSKDISLARQFSFLDYETQAKLI